MANHIFPLLLSGAKEQNSGTFSWSGNTSVVELTAASTVTVGDAELAGTLLTIIATTAVSSTITFTNSVSSSNDDVTLDAAGESVLAMWNGSAWLIIGGVETPAAA